ncbi:MAG TPA: hypothetical protein ENJ44_02070, partial [Oceanospirillales bacterium]|nr:hypothetical protein [Oceanospirillales bacterium]
MVLKAVKLRIFLVAIVLLIATTFAYGDGNTGHNNILRLSTFNSKESAQKFYHSIPQDARSSIKKDQLWLSVSQNQYDFGLYHIDINAISDQQATKICSYV